MCIYLCARGHALSAALIKNFEVHEFSTRIYLQAICDQFGNALDRYNSHQQEIDIRAHAQTQLVRNNLLAAFLMITALHWQPLWAPLHHWMSKAKN